MCNASYDNCAWRSTSAPDWEHFQTVGSSARASLRVSKDNGILGFKVSEFQGFKEKHEDHTTLQL
jgi:hypothetical protein